MILEVDFFAIFKTSLKKLAITHLVRQFIPIVPPRLDNISIVTTETRRQYSLSRNRAVGIKIPIVPTIRPGILTVDIDQTCRLTEIPIKKPIEPHCPPEKLPIAQHPAPHTSAVTGFRIDLNTRQFCLQLRPAHKALIVPRPYYALEQNYRIARGHYAKLGVVSDIA